MRIAIKVTTKFDSTKFAAATGEAVNAGLTHGAIAASGFMKAGMSTVGRYTASSPGQPPNVRRGALRRSVTFSASTNFVSSAGSNLPYARIQESGGTIKPRRGRFIPVPLNVPAMRLQEQFGGATATEFFAGAGGSTGYISTFNGGLRRLDLHVEKTRGGALFLVGKRPKRVRYDVGNGGWLADKAIPRWLLARSVRIPPRPWCVPAVNKNLPAIQGAAVARARDVLASRGFAARGTG